ncbi:MAG TPA: alpha/beta hydrolase [Steroidobacteraceae bacterium]|nr:alpha/beta hydrolase [Steroidobacteraceae bacterium]
MSVAEKFDDAIVDGRVLRYVCGGDGVPPVVVDQGQGLSIERGLDRAVRFGWAKVFSEIRKSTRIVMHDRAGLGSSDRSNHPRACLEMVQDLRAVLLAADSTPPYVLVGHSVGGLNIQTFAARYPDEVAGMVLVDSSHPDQMARMAGILPPESSGESPPLKALRRGVDPSVSAENIDFQRCGEQARVLKTLGRAPLMVVSQSPHAFAPPGISSELWGSMRLVWSDLQTSLLTLSPNSRQLVAQHAGHHVQAEEPQLVIDAILEIVNCVRAGVVRAN